MTFFWKCRMPQESVGGKECLVQSVIYMGQRAISFVKDKSSYQCLLVTAKE